MGVIYLRTNLINGKQYVGQTVNFSARQSNWKNLNKNYSNDFISKERNEYGIDNFSVEILFKTDDRDKLNEMEMYYIKTLNTRYPNGYNMCDGGKGCSGWKMPEEQRLKLSESRKGEKNHNFGKLPWNALRKPPKSFGEAVSKGLKGKTKGRKKSEEHKKKIGEAHSIPIIQLTTDNKFIKEWKSAAEASRNGYNFSHICACCRGERKKHHNCHWVRKDDYLSN